MASNSGGSDFLAMLLGLVVMAAVGALIVAVAITFVLTICAFFFFLAFCWSSVCYFAWDKPLRLGKLYLHPDDARAFVIRGAFGAVMLPFFLLVAGGLLDIEINWDYLGYYIASGYTLLSAGLEYMMARRQDIPYVRHDRPAPYREALPAPRQEYLPPPSRPERFASWDDEENDISWDEEGRPIPPLIPRPGKYR